MAALVKRYRAPAYALLSQVANGTGWQSYRWADALVMSLWPSRGLHLSGFEVKVGRNDWLRELKNPAKADEIAVFCDFWWVVVGGPDIVKLEELPHGWGLLELKGKTLVQVRAAEIRRDANALDKPMVAAILRRAVECMTPTSSIDEQLRQKHEEGLEAGKRAAARETGDDAIRRELADLKDSLSRFEAASGVAIERYNGARLGEAFILARRFNEAGLRHSLKNIEHSLEAALDSIQRAQREHQVAARV